MVGITMYFCSAHTSTLIAKLDIQECSVKPPREYGLTPPKKTFAKLSWVGPNPDIVQCHEASPTQVQHLDPFSLLNRILKNPNRPARDPRGLDARGRADPRETRRVRAVKYRKKKLCTLFKFFTRSVIFGPLNDVVQMGYGAGNIDRRGKFPSKTKLEKRSFFCALHCA